MDGVLELGTTDSVLENPDLVNRATTPFSELQFPSSTEEPNSCPSTDDDTGEATDIIVFEDVDHNASSMEPMMISDANLEKVSCLEIDELYNLCEGLDVQALEDDWIGMDDEAPPSPEPALATDDGDHALISTNGSRFSSSFKAWTRPESNSRAAAAAAGAPQKMLKKVVSGGAWASGDGGDGSRARGPATTQEESGVVKSHVMSERRRREKLNEMFIVLKSLIPSTRKVDKASILAETIAHLKELERRVQELESSKELISIPRPAAERRHDDEVVVVGARKAATPGRGAKRKKKGSDSELDAAGDGQMAEQHWVRPNDGRSNVISIAVGDKEVLLDVQCRWEERLMARVFDAVKSLRLDIVSVQSSTLDGLMGLKVRAQFASSAAVAPGMITEALQEAISSRT
ncbi:hypothetical protein PVAP13_3NG202900 [Panicum virgatum]|uniref:BHLH domain-containing protein n=2 Tax=Panicum virgatum TaxID=38727 RepID=A0A8T0UFT6_PANVG|nr:hypothetical protein PVAP13_3NG202900 [Panicum virgatum]